AYLAAHADALGFPRRAALLGEERLGVGLGAQRPLLPLGVVGGKRRQTESVGHQRQMGTFTDGARRFCAGVGLRRAAYRAVAPVDQLDGPREFNVLVRRFAS